MDFKKFVWRPGMNPGERPAKVECKHDGNTYRDTDGNLVCCRCTKIITNESLLRNGGHHGPA